MKVAYQEGKGKVEDSGSFQLGTSDLWNPAWHSWGGSMGMTLMSVSSLQVVNHSFDEVGGGGVTAHVSRPHLGGR